MDPFTKGKHLALLGHLALVGAFLIAIASWQEKHKVPAGSFTMVALADSGLGDGAKMGGDSSATEAPKPAEESEPEPPQEPKSPAIPSPVVLPKVELPKTKPQVAKQKPAPAKKPVSKPITSYADFLKANPKTKPLGTTKTKPTKKPSTNSFSPTPAPSGPTFGEALSEGLSQKLGAGNSASSSGGLASAAGDSTFGQGGLSGLGGTATDTEALYIGAVYTYLNAAWVEPKQLGGVHLKAKTQFNVDSNGNITSWKIVSPSGSTAFDNSVAAVFAKIKRVSAPPAKTDYRLFIEFETRQK
jgi:TonB family protein